MIRQCEKCSATTTSRLSDFHLIAWEAFQIPNAIGIVKCYCPSHKKDCTQEMVEALKKYGHRKKVKE